MGQDVIFCLGDGELIGCAKIVDVIEYGDNQNDTIFKAELVSIKEGDPKRWDGTLLESELIRVYSNEGWEIKKPCKAPFIENVKRKYKEWWSFEEENQKK